MDEQATKQQPRWPPPFRTFTEQERLKREAPPRRWDPHFKPMCEEALRDLPKLLERTRWT